MGKILPPQLGWPSPGSVAWQFCSGLTSWVKPHVPDLPHMLIGGSCEEQVREHKSHGAPGLVAPATQASPLFPPTPRANCPRPHQPLPPKTPAHKGSPAPHASQTLLRGGHSLAFLKSPQLPPPCPMRPTSPPSPLLSIHIRRCTPPQTGLGGEVKKTRKPLRGVTAENQGTLEMEAGGVRCPPPPSSGWKPCLEALVGCGCHSGRGGQRAGTRVLQKLDYNSVGHTPRPLATQVHTHTYTRTESFVVRLLPTLYSLICHLRHTCYQGKSDPEHPKISDLTHGSLPHVC